MLVGTRSSMGYDATLRFTADQALARLREGNKRFTSNVRSIEALASQATRGDLVDGQSPFAILLSCSDSRVPSEIVFDCGLGDLFVVRIAGNCVAPSIVGSVEFAVAAFGTELVIVMGHQKCGAVKATIEALDPNAPRSISDNVRDIVDRIMPSVVELKNAGLPYERLLPAAIRSNVRASVSHLRHGTALLERRIAEGRLRIVGAEYSLATGFVDFFDGVDENGMLLAG
jgi:carbonic anhydrase